jgi:hypothetical protein
VDIEIKILKLKNCKNIICAGGGGAASVHTNMPKTKNKYKKYKNAAKMRTCRAQCLVG